MFLASSPTGGAPMAGDRLQPFSADAEAAALSATGQQAEMIGRTVTGLSATRQTLAVRMRTPVTVSSGAAMPTVTGSASSDEVQP
ncbi:MULTISPECIES: hypothetical protein [Kordiimonas]|jgi:hypothetical protein|uniref:hypothetical protein n=1 Tax=Kordiimonas TaxID=288021 RepID=UPI00257E8E0D|nr:hypothetical protein [Kordiimonas sp. UBA4487]